MPLTSNLVSDDKIGDLPIIYRDGVKKPDITYKYIPILIPDEDEEEPPKEVVKISKIEIGGVGSGRLEHMIDKITEELEAPTFSQLIDEIFEEYQK